MNIAIFGGSFDPVHRGHFEIVRQILKYSPIDRIIVVPNYQNPLKKRRPTLPDELRWEMLKTTFFGIKEVELSDFELKQHKRNFTYSTILHFKERFPQDQLYLILGEDAFAYFDEWAKTDIILEMSKIAVFYRPALRTERTSASIEAYGDIAEFIPIEIPDISATEIRQNSLETIEHQSWLLPEALVLWKNYLKNSNK
ncbi:MAG: nicotinate (nicotinamide) nucleotide adenylyltransferase [Deltaproteobacteria bacterium]|jgi:nicotinate-nucleotide adenylyltransferase|nr:nicotinate (nicotinamide) nucleotide adenylyltransferase [Deltaproteobacteria bacterium]